MCGTSDAAHPLLSLWKYGKLPEADGALEDMPDMHAQVTCSHWVERQNTDGPNSRHAVRNIGKANAVL